MVNMPVKSGRLFALHTDMLSFIGIDKSGKKLNVQVSTARKFGQ